jgi:hypothetical protein
MYDAVQRSTTNLFTRRAVSERRTSAAMSTLLTRTKPEDIAQFQTVLFGLVTMCYNLGVKHSTASDDQDWTLEPMILPKGHASPKKPHVKFQFSIPGNAEAKERSKTGESRKVEGYHGEVDGKRGIPSPNAGSKRLHGSFAISIDQTKDAVTRQKAKGVLKHVEQLQVLTTYASDAALRKCPVSNHMLITWDAVNTHPYSRSDADKKRDKVFCAVLIPPIVTKKEAENIEEELGQKFLYLGRQLVEKNKSRYLVTNEPHEYYNAVFGEDGKAPPKIMSNEAVRITFSSNMVAESTTPDNTPVSKKTGKKRILNNDTSKTSAVDTKPKLKKGRK